MEDGRQLTGPHRFSSVFSPPSSVFPSHWALGFMGAKLKKSRGERVVTM